MVLLLAVTAVVAGLASHVAMTEFYPEGLKRGLWLKAVNRGFAAFSDDYRLRDTYKHVPTYVARMTSSADLPGMSIDIDFLDMQKLEAKRSEALRKNNLETADDDYVSGWIRTGNKRVKVRLRLKGDDIDHLKQDKWSFRIHLSGEDHLWGLRSFSIQHPITRGFHGEVFYYETLKQYDVLTPRYFFVKVSVNGNDIGIMAVEEFMSKELLESNGRKESVIVKFDESLKWAGRDSLTYVPSRGYEKSMPFESYRRARIDTFQTSRVMRSANLQRDFETASGLLRGFVEDGLPAHEVFDVQRLASYLAVAEFYGAFHDVVWNNMRFYFNPLTLKLEPVAFDAGLNEPIKIGKSISRGLLVRKMLEDPQVNSLFRRVHDDLVSRLNEGSFVEWLKGVEAPLLQSLQLEYFMLEAYPTELLVARAAALPRNLRPNVDLRWLPKLVHAYLIKAANDDYLEIANQVPYEVTVGDLFWVGEQGEVVPFEPLSGLPQDGIVKLPPTPVGGVSSSVRIPYMEPRSDVQLQLKLQASVTGYEEEREVTAQVGYPALLWHPFPDSSLAEQLQRHAFLSVDESERTVQVEAGEWNVDGDILIPEGLEVRITAGTTLRFDTDAVFVINGIVKFEGTADRQIVLDGKPGVDGAPGTWNGMAIYNASQRSRWSHVVVRNTSSISRGPWRLTGGVTFYRSDVDMLDCSFENAFGEDALNIVHSNYKLTDIEIYNTVSDGFDADFTTGVIERGIFREIGTSGGGDAVDFSGSKAEIVGSRFDGVRDKAISAGEGSQLEVKLVDIDRSGIGISSKDTSEVRVDGATIRNVQFAGLMAYRKKPEYGPATLIATNTEFADTPAPAMVQTGSTLTLNGETIQSEAIDVDGLYETVMKPGIEK